MTDIKKTAAAMLCAVMTLASCSASGSSAPEASLITREAQPSDENIVYNNQAALMGSDGSVEYAEPFSSYTFDFSDGAGKYMITVEPGKTPDALSLTLENSDFSYYEYEITAPENYALNIPYSQDTASSVCNVIKNTIDDTPVPDILEFTFYLNNYSSDQLPYSVTKYYSVKDGELCEIELYEMDDSGDEEILVIDAGAVVMGRTSLRTLNINSSVKMEYLSDGSMLHTEPLVFMPYPNVSIEKAKNGWKVNADIYVYRFDPVKMTMKKELQPSDYSKSPLYFGYKAHAVADYIAKYFTTASLNVSDYNNYVEMPSVNADTSDYYFKVDDPRFGTLDELRAFTRCFFTEKLVSDMFINAPQKYRDIDGALYTVVGDGGRDFTLGKLTITDHKEDKGSVTYHTKQEKFSDDGKFTGYIDGGDFTVELKDDGSIYITQYRFRY